MFDVVNKVVWGVYIDAQKYKTILILSSIFRQIIKNMEKNYKLSTYFT